MSRITPPLGYFNWTTYIEDQVAGITDPVARRQAKKDIKLDIIASVERYANGDTTSPSYRVGHIYETPGTVAPTQNRPWVTESTDSLAQLLTEDGAFILTEDNNELTAE